MEGDQRAEGEAALRDRYEGWCAVWHRWHLGELERSRFGRMDSDVCHHHHRFERAGRRDPRPHAGHPRAGRLRPLACDEPDLMRPFPAHLMRMWPISTRVNKPENDDPSIIEPIEL